MENTSPHPPHKKPKPHAVVHKLPARKIPPLNTKAMQGFGWDESVAFKIELTGIAVGDNGAPNLHLPTARHDLMVRLRWNRNKVAGAVTKADVDLVQVGAGYDTMELGTDKELPSEHRGKAVHFYMHTIRFEINFVTTVSPIIIDLGQKLKIDELKKINSIWAGTIKGIYDIESEYSSLDVFFI